MASKVQGECRAELCWAAAFTRRCNLFALAKVRLLKIVITIILPYRRLLHNIRYIKKGIPPVTPFFFFFSDSRRKGTKEDCYPQGPLQRGMQLITGRDRPSSRFWYRSRAFAPSGFAISFFIINHFLMWVHQGSERSGRLLWGWRFSCEGACHRI